MHALLDHSIKHLEIGLLKEFDDDELLGKIQGLERKELQSVRSILDFGTHSYLLEFGESSLPRISSVHLRMMPPAAGFPICIPPGINLNKQLLDYCKQR